MIAIVAGNAKQAMDWLRDEGFPTLAARYISSPDVLRGYRNVDVVYVGTYFDRKDIFQIKDELRRVGIKTERWASE